MPIVEVDTGRSQVVYVRPDGQREFLIDAVEYVRIGIPTHGCYDTLARHRWTREFGHGRFAFM